MFFLLCVSCARVCLWFGDGVVLRLVVDVGILNCGVSVREDLAASEARVKHLSSLLEAGKYHPLSPV